MRAIPFVNRDKEKRHLRNMLASQDTQVLLVSGPEGVGKTSLLREFTTSPEADTDYVALYRTVQPEVGLSPTFLDMELELPDVAARNTPDGADLFSPRLSTTLRRKVRATGSGIERLNSATSLGEVITIFAESLTEISERLKRDQKLVLLFDLQPGLDTRSKQALIGLHKLLPKGVKLVLALPEPKDSLEFRSHVPQLQLHPLSREDAEAVLRTCCEAPLSAELFEMISQHFDGHPLAIVALTRLLGNEYPSSGNELPTSLPGLFDVLLGGLDEADRRVIQVLAVLLEPADITLVANISGLTTRAVEQISSRNRVLRLLDWEKLSQERFQLFHSLLGKQIVRDSPRPILRELHAKAAKYYGHDFETYWQNPRALGYCLEHLRLSDTVEYIRFVTSPEVRVLMQIWGISDLAGFHLQEALRGVKNKPETVWVQLVGINDNVIRGEANVPSGLIPSESLLLRDLGYFSRLDGAFEIAAEYYWRALEVLEEDQRPAKRTANLSQQAEIWMEFAELYRAQIMYDLALEALQRSRGLYELLLREDSTHPRRWRGYLCRCWHNIGVILRDLGLREKQNEKSGGACRPFRQALEAFHQALALAVDDTARLEALIQIGYVHVELSEIMQVLEEHVQEAKDHLSEATDAYEEALAVARSVGNIEALAIASGNLSSLSLQAGLPAEAATHAQVAVNAFEQLGMSEAVGQARTLLAQAQAQVSDTSRDRASYSKHKRE